MANRNMTWSSLKSIATLLYAQYVGSGLLLDGDTGDPSGLAQVVDLVNQRVTGYPFEWDFLKAKNSFTIDGSRSYDLKVLFPDFASLYQIYGINSNQESTPLPDYDANVYPFYDAYQILDGVVTFTGNVPTAGTVAYIQYKSIYLVRDAVTGAPKRYFEDNDDYTALSPQFDAVLTYGIGQFVDWIADSKAREQRQTMDDRFKEAWTNMLLYNPGTSQLHNML